MHRGNYKHGLKREDRRLQARPRHSSVIVVIRRGKAHTPGDDEHPSMCANCSPSPRWRNRDTRRTQNAVPATACRFNSDTRDTFNPRQRSPTTNTHNNRTSFSLRSEQHPHAEKPHILPVAHRDTLPQAHSPRHCNRTTTPSSLSDSGSGAGLVTLHAAEPSAGP
jgi:hypothetical protein